MSTVMSENAATERLAWLADQAAQTFADRPDAASRWLETARRDLAGFTPAQCAFIGGAPMARAMTLLRRATASEHVPMAAAPIVADAPPVRTRLEAMA